MFSWIYALGVLLLALGLPIFSYLTLIYRELGRMTTGRVHEHLDIFEAEIEPKLHINRRSGGRTIRNLRHFSLGRFPPGTHPELGFFLAPARGAVGSVLGVFVPASRRP